MKGNVNIQIFIALLRAGLWEKDTRLLPYVEVDYNEIMRIAEIQSVEGLVTAGIEHIIDAKPPQEVVLQFIGQSLQIEHRNRAMNRFVAEIVDKIREKVNLALLVKGQGIAQCYERPLWRSSGDVDLFLDKNSIEKVKPILSTKINSIVEDKFGFCHYSLRIDQWDVELHGSLRGGLSRRIDRLLDRIGEETLKNGEIREWKNGNTIVFLPNPDNDVIFVFTHILQHLFKGGIGLRQICDLCRLLWIYNHVIDNSKLYIRLLEMELVSEWKVFGCLMVDFLGLSKEAMPFYDKAYSRKAQKVLIFILETGNFGHNRDNSHLLIKQSLVRKSLIAWNQFKDCIKLMKVFPIDAPRFYFRYMVDGITASINVTKNNLGTSGNVSCQV